MIGSNVVNFPVVRALATRGREPTVHEKSVSRLMQLAGDPSSPFARRLRELEELRTGSRAARCV